MLNRQALNFSELYFYIRPQAEYIIAAIFDSAI